MIPLIDEAGQPKALPPQPLRVAGYRMINARNKNISQALSSPRRLWMAAYRMYMQLYNIY